MNMMSDDITIKQWVMAIIIGGVVAFMIVVMIQIKEINGRLKKIVYNQYEIMKVAGIKFKTVNADDVDKALKK